MKKLPLIVLALLKDGKFTPKDIWSILHRQQSGEFQLVILREDRFMPLPEDMEEKAGEIIAIESAEFIGEEINKLARSRDNELFIFFRNYIQPTHDHWIKRITSPEMENSSQVIVGKTITTPSANYFLDNDLQKRETALSSGEAGSFSIDNCAIPRALLAEKPLPLKSFDPLLVWSLGDKLKVEYRAEALAMRYTRLPLKVVYQENFQKGFDLSVAGRRQGLMISIWKTGFETLLDILYCLKKIRPQFIWYPPALRFVINLGIYNGGRKAS